MSRIPPDELRNASTPCAPTFTASAVSRSSRTPVSYRLPSLGLRKKRYFLFNLRLIGTRADRACPTKGSDRGCARSNLIR